MSKRQPIPFPEIVIEGVEPEIDCGRHPAKAIVGEPWRVRADVFRDGHDLLATRLLFRGPGDSTWSEVPMRHDERHDRWEASFVPDRIGRWTFTIEAWTDRWGTWRRNLRKKLDAGQDVATELLEGGLLLEAASRRGRGETAARLAEAAARLGDREASAVERAARALTADVDAMASAHPDRMRATRYAREVPVTVDRERARFSTWYEMFPRSQAPAPGRHGTFADAERQLPRIAHLGFDVVYLPPIHPIGRVHRKGKNNSVEAEPGDVGSPWAIGSEEGGHTAVHPELGTLEDFERFVRSANALGLEVALDYALQTAPDHPWAREHPEWFFVRPDGSIQYAENPPKKYQDIYPLNFWSEDWKGLWEACRDVFLFWIARGVKIFRVDNPHTKPFAFWEWVIGEVTRAHPEVLFLSEAFTRPKPMRALAKLGFSQSYTYFTWRNTAWELREYLTELVTQTADYLRPNFFANTPDILHEYLQKGGPPAFRVRLLLAGTLSPSYGIYSGFELCERVPLREGSEEYLDSEKYEIRVRDFDAPGNLNAEIARLNRVRRENPALQRLTNLSFHLSENDSILFYRKAAPGNELLVAVNLDPFRAQETMVHVPLADLGLGPDEPFVVEDLLTGDRFRWRGVRNYVKLDPATPQAGHVLRVTPA